MTLGRGVLLATFLLGVAFAPFMRGSFVWDDALLIERNPAMIAHDQLGAVLTRDLWGQASGTPSQLYHPVPMLTIWLQSALFGLRVWPMRVFNVLIHALVVALFVRLLRELRLSRVLALCTGLLVLVHPTVTEPVMWITGRHDTLAMCGVLGALLLWPDSSVTRLRAMRALGSGAALALAMLCKEPYVVAPALLLLYAGTRAMQDARWPRRSELGLFSVALGPFVAVLWLRHTLHISLGSTQLGVPLLEHARSFAAVVLHYAAQLLSFSNSATLAPYVALGTSAALGVWALLLGISAGLSWMAWRARGAFVAAWLGWAWFLVSLAPHVISVPSIGMFGNRYAYCALLGLALCVASLVVALASRLTSPRVVMLSQWAVLALSVSLALLTGQQASHWSDNYTLYSADLARDPDNGYAMYHVGTAVLSAGGCERALGLFVRATELAPGYERPWHNVTGCLITLGRAHEASYFAERDVALAPQSSRAHYNLAVVLASTQQRQRAQQHLRRCLQLEPSYAPARAALARLAAASPASAP